MKKNFIILHPHTSPHLSSRVQSFGVEQREQRTRSVERIFAVANIKYCAERHLAWRRGDGTQILHIVITAFYRAKRALEYFQKHNHKKPRRGAIDTAQRNALGIHAHFIARASLNNFFFTDFPERAKNQYFCVLRRSSGISTRKFILRLLALFSSTIPTALPWASSISPRWGFKI